MLQLPDISGAIRLDLNPLKQAFDEAASETRAFSADVGAALKGIGIAAGAVGVAVGAAFVGVGAFVADATRDSFKIADDLHDMAINVGVGVEALHGLGLAAQLSGAGVGDVAESYKFLGKNVSEAMQGSKEAVAGFERMGVAFADASGKARPLEDVMMDVADAIKDLDAGARGEAAMQLLGRGGTQMIATLSQGSTALREQMRLYERYGATVSTQAANAADALGDMFGEFDIAWMGLKNAIGEPIIEGVTPVFEKILAWTRTNVPDINSSINAAIGSVVDEISRLIGSTHGIGPAFTSAGELVINAMEGVSLSISKSLDLLDTLERKRSGAGKWLAIQTTEARIGQLQGQLSHTELQFAPGVNNPQGFQDQMRKEADRLREEIAITTAQLRDMKAEQSRGPANFTGDVTASFGNIRAGFKTNMINQRIDDTLDEVMRPAEDFGKSLFDRIDMTLDSVFPKEGDESVIDRIDEALDEVLGPAEAWGKSLFARIDATLDSVFPKEDGGDLLGVRRRAMAEEQPPKLAEFIRPDSADAFRFTGGGESSADTAKKQLGVQQKMLRALEQASRNQPVILKMG